MSHDTFRIPAELAPVVSEIQEKYVRYMVIYTLHRLFHLNKPAKQHSRIVKAIVCPQRYKNYLAMMYKLKDAGWIDRNENYVPAQFAGIHATCKAWFVVSHLQRSVVDGDIPMCSVSIPSSFMERVREKFDRCADDAIAAGGPVGELLRNRREAADWESHSMMFLGLRAGVLDCCTPEQLPFVERSERLLCGSQRVVRYGNGRSYHAVVSLPSDLRKSHLVWETSVTGCDGEQHDLVTAPASVDAHASQPFIAICCLTSGAERERLIDMYFSGDFYAAFGGENMDRAKVKKSFLTILFDRDSRSKVWKRFKALFPMAARAIAKIRDSGKFFRWKWNKDGRKVVSAWGQRLMSDFLVTIESRAFDIALEILKRQRVKAVRVHDELICEPWNREKVVQAVKLGYQEILGLAPIVK